ncbi:fimbrial protein [Pseudomonas sp. BN411]|uniref:fimbrial protein n=1 Tax=Pseudomonas sp. BN411 TaxID=2567887 RepID=UPI00245387F3|nr:fimbrial protein [Pseudomonas sp. BN411]MDH4560578.1 type 1 fimbrial protein [Pseudomonas sp. BN411]
MIKKLTLAALVAAASQAALASPNTSIIQFRGVVQGNTCDISVNGVTTPTPTTVTLADALAENLTKAGDTTGETDFDIELKNCSGPGTKARASFKGGNGTTVANGRLDNLASAGAENVQLELVHKFSGAGSAIAVDGDQSALPYVDIVGGAARLPYAIRYYATGAATQGPVEGAVEFTVAYQ